MNERQQLLIAHVTGQKQWDIPKGGAESGESPVQAAIRETFEETGIALTPEILSDLGIHRYLTSKDLHLFKAEVSSRDHDIALCKCTSFFPHHRTGEPTPEVDAFRWIDASEIADYCTPRLTALLASVLT